MGTYTNVDDDRNLGAYAHGEEHRHKIMGRTRTSRQTLTSDTTSDSQTNEETWASLRDDRVDGALIHVDCRYEYKRHGETMHTTTASSSITRRRCEFHLLCLFLERVINHNTNSAHRHTRGPENKTTDRVRQKRALRLSLFIGDGWCAHPGLWPLSGLVHIVQWYRNCGLRETRK